jgi:hypothetical protein
MAHEAKYLFFYANVIRLWHRIPQIYGIAYTATNHKWITFVANVIHLGHNTPNLYRAVFHNMSQKEVFWLFFRHFDTFCDILCQIWGILCQIYGICNIFVSNFRYFWTNVCLCLPQKKICVILPQICGMPLTVNLG